MTGSGRPFDSFLRVAAGRRFGKESLIDLRDCEARHDPAADSVPNHQPRQHWPSMSTTG
jgi:hypothetical protein